MKKCEDIIPVYEFRPILRREHGTLYRYAKGEWLKDDGEYDIAFAQPDTCMAYHVFVPNRESIIWSWAKHGKWGDFVSEHPRGNAWHYMLRDGMTEWTKCWQKHSHENEKAGDEAMKFVSSRSGCSNGTGPEFHIDDEYIVQGLLRLQDSKEIVKFPDIFNCMYCGEIDWRKEEAELHRRKKNGK